MQYIFPQTNLFPKVVFRLIKKTYFQKWALHNLLSVSVFCLKDNGEWAINSFSRLLNSLIIAWGPCLDSTFFLAIHKPTLTHNKKKKGVKGLSHSQRTFWRHFSTKISAAPRNLSLTSPPLTLIPQSKSDFFGLVIIKNKTLFSYWFKHYYKYKIKINYIRRTTEGL